MKLNKLPEPVLNYLWRYEYRKKVADKDTFRNLDEELHKFGYSFTDEDVNVGDYNDLRGYLGCDIEKEN